MNTWTGATLANINPCAGEITRATAGPQRLAWRFRS